MTSNRRHVVSAGVAVALLLLESSGLWAADLSPIQTTVSVDADQILRTMSPRRLGGTNIALWTNAATYASPQVREWIAELRAGYIRLPGGSWSNVVYWNGNGVRGADGKVDPAKVGPDGFPAVDYSTYAPSFLVDEKTLRPKSDGWHGNVDVKTLHDFIAAMPGAEAMPCPNAGTGRAVDAAEWVKWANGKQGYGIRTWEIGNELGGSWEAGTFLPFGKGNLTAEMYTKRYNEMASAMRKADPTIKIGSCPFVEQALRDCGTNVDFVSIHTYPGSTTAADAQMFADIGKTIEREVGTVRKWIRQYQPQREKEIEIAYTEWNLAGGVSASGMFSGLWASIFLGEMARHGVDFAAQWDAFTHATPNPDGHALILEDGPRHTRKAQYYALWLWNNYMGDKLISATSGDAAVYTYASRSDDAVYVMLLNTDHDREARVHLELSGFAPAETGERATVSSREYYWNPLTHLPQWSTGPRIEQVKTAANMRVSLAPFSMTYLRVPAAAKPALSAVAQKALAAKPQPAADAVLRFVLPAEAYAGDAVNGAVIAMAAGRDGPYSGALPPAALAASGNAAVDRTHARLDEAMGRFSFTPAAPGELTITAQSGTAKAAHTLTVKPSVPRPVVFWDFTNPLATNTDVFHSDFKLNEDPTQRANRAVARVDLPPEGAVPTDKVRQLLFVKQIPDGDKLRKENIRGVVFDVKTSTDFSSDDPNAGITVVMQSPADWWMVLGDIPLKGVTQWKTVRVDVTQDKHIKAMPSAGNLWFLLKTGKPAKGSIYFDQIGLMVR